MLGADVFLSERKKARETLGTTFDIREFHEIVLAAGVRPLPQVREDIRKWVKEKLEPISK